MKKRIWSITLVLALCLALFAGCSSSDSATEATAAPADTSSAADSSADVATEETSWVPTKDIEITVGASAGGGADLFARKVVEIVQQYDLCPTNITVVNKSGSSHVIGFTYLVETGGDYNINVVSSSFYAQPASGNSPLTFEDFSYVSLVCKDPSLLIASKDSGFESLDDIIAYATENPGMISFAGSSAISDDAILWAQVCQQCDIDMTYIAMDSGSDVLTNVMGGHVQLGAMSPSEIGDNLAAGNLTAIAIAADDRFDQFGLDETPTFVELGYEINHQQHRGFVMAADASDEALNYYSDMIEAVYNTTEWQEYMEANCMAGFYLNTDEYTDYNANLVETYETYIAIVQSKQAS